MRNFCLKFLPYNIIVVNMIPGFIDLTGAPWRVLPQGIHPATLPEVETTLAINPRRRELFAGFVVGANALAAAGCQLLYLDGSYVTENPAPGDFDVCWEPAGVNPAKLDPVFFDMSNKRAAQKAKFNGEFLPVYRDSNGHSFIDFFQIEKFSGGKKGILSVQLSIAHMHKGITP
ncbi:MAG TPA: hypothetical protein VGK90_08030 [Rhizomicrobium sp.]